ncbi:MAG: hypothetical protein E7C49_15700 [Clostridium sp.]|nr:hypothetical protein [Clostridium sp.]
MSKEKGLKLILIIIVSCILINFSINAYHSIKQKKLIKESEERREDYKSNRMRFPIKINAGEYKVIDYGDNYLLDNEEGLKLFDKASEFIYLEKVDTKYSEYIITENTTYVCADIEYEENYMQYLEYHLPITNNQLNNLRNFMRETNNESLEVVPFNDGIHCFISGKSEQYILNIDNKELLWTRGSYYESPIFDPVTDTLTCGGDLSATDYVFNKYGELIETKEYGITKGFLTLWIFNFTAIVSALFIIQLMVNKNVKSIGIKLITNIFLVPIILLISVMVLWFISIIF